MSVFQEFTFPSSTGKNTVRCLKCLPDSEPRGIVQIEHGIAEHIDRYRDFMRGSTGKSLEERFLVRFKQIDTLNDRLDDTIDRVKLLEDARDTSFKKIAIHRYDAFAEMGGKLSNSLCLLNDDNDGFIMTSMHNREGCYTYVKEVIKGNTFVILSEEER